MEPLGVRQQKRTNKIEVKSTTGQFSHENKHVDLVDQSGDMKRTGDIGISMNIEEFADKSEERPSWKNGGRNSLFSFLIPGKRCGRQSVRVDVSDSLSGRKVDKGSVGWNKIRKSRKSNPGKRWSGSVSSASDVSNDKSQATFICTGTEQPTGNFPNHLQVPTRTKKKRKSASSASVVNTCSLANVKTEKLEESQYSDVETTVKSEKSNENSAMNQPKEQAEDSVDLFTSVQQLCFEIINKMLLNKSTDRCRSGNENRALCLFMFGCQGSSKGEIAFELLEHSPLRKTLATTDNEDYTTVKIEREFSDNSIECPIYHHVDVAAIIVANIDARINEYRRLVEQTLRTRERLELNETILLNDSALYDAQDHTQNEDDEVEESYNETDDYRQNASISSDSSNCKIYQSTISDEENNHQHDCFGASKIDDFGLITLTTKQRSVLQLKLMKYYNSVTAKWIFDLIQLEVDKLELLVKQKWSDANRRAPDRIYMINLVPNQLSLFKSCLYLRQNFPLREFKYPFWAIKFERRTNIKLLSKERVGIDKHQQQQLAAKKIGKQQPSDSNSLQKKNSRIKLPSIFLGGSHNTNLNPPNPASPELKDTNLDGLKDSVSKPNNSIATVAGEFLASEKLGPKYNEQFAQQFKSMNKLIQVRYNQVRDYNYAHYNDVDDNITDRSYIDGVGQKRSSTRGCCASVLSAESHNGLFDDERYFNGLNSRLISSSLLNLKDQPPGGATVHHHRLSLSNSPIDINITQEFESSLISPSNQHHTTGQSCPDQLSILAASSATSLLSAGTSTSLTSRLSEAVSDHTSISESISNAHHPGKSNPQRSVLASNNSLPIAIELELFDSSDIEAGIGARVGDSCTAGIVHIKWRVGSSANDGQVVADSIDANSGDNPIYYVDPKNQRSSSKSPLTFASSHRQRHQSTSASVANSTNPSGYRLVPVRIAYANNQSQIVLEVKRVHSRTMKLKSQIDITRLNKLISKLRGQLISDCENWLFEAIAKEHHRKLRHLNGSSTSMGNSNSPTNAHPTSHLIQGTTGKEQQLTYKDMMHQQLPALIVYAIRVDLSAIKSGGFHYPAHFNFQLEPPLVNDRQDDVTAASDLERGSGPGEHQQTQSLHSSPIGAARTHLVPILKASNSNNGSAKQRTIATDRPASAITGHYLAGTSVNLLSATDNQRPSSSRSHSGSHRRGDKHVQFKLNRAPRAMATGAGGQWRDQLAALQPQRRLWIGDSMFVSANDEPLSKLLTLVAALISYEQVS